MKGTTTPPGIFIEFSPFPDTGFYCVSLRRRPGRIWEVFFEFPSSFWRNNGWGMEKNRRGMGERNCPEASLKSQEKSLRNFEGNLGNLIRRNFLPGFTCCFSACFRCKANLFHQKVLARPLTQPALESPRKKLQLQLSYISYIFHLIFL